jgi:hypothetical protein
VGPLQLKILLLLVALLLSAVVALVAGILMRVAGAPVIECMLKGGGAFAASMLLCLGVLAL